MERPRAWPVPYKEEPTCPTLRASAFPKPLATYNSNLDIVDGDGRTRMVLGSFGPDPVPGFTIYNEAGEERVTLALYDTGPQLSFVLGGFGVLEIGVADPDHPEVGTPGAFLYLIEHEGDTVYGWQAGDPSWRPRSQR